MKIALALVALVVVVLIGVILWISSPRGPRLRDVAHLQEPHLATLAPQIAGPHEEEYLRGPGMLFAGDPGTYLTLIRYQVRRKASAGAP